MKEKLHRFFSCLMALMLLASTTSWTVGKHYCMGHLMDVSLFAHAEVCGMDTAVADTVAVSSKEANSCCKDEIITVDGQDHLKISFDDFSFDQQLFLVNFTHCYSNLLQIRSERRSPNELYPPPLLVKDIQLLDAVFLI